MSASLGVPPLAPQADASELARQEVQTRLAGVGGKNMTEAQKDKKLREACQGFESIFIQKMWQEMRNTLPKSNLLQGREEQFWQGMYDQELAKKMAGAGGVGLADMMYSQLSQRLGSASQSAAAAASSVRSFSPEAAPLLPHAAEGTAVAGQDAATAQGHGKAGAQGPLASIYDGAAPLRDAGAVSGAPVVAGAGQAGGTEAAAVTNPPEVDQALAVLQAQQALQQSGNAGSQKHIRVTHAGQGDSGLRLARAAQFQAGSKLGPGAVLPALHSTGADAGHAVRSQAGVGQGNSAAGLQQGMPAGAVPPLTAQGGGGLAATGQTGLQQAAGQGMPPAAVAAENAAAPGMPDKQNAQQPMKMRYTTNIPSKSKRHKNELIRTLQTDAAGPNSRAGAGLAAYHAQQAQQAQAGQSAQTGQPTGMPLTQAAAVPEPVRERGAAGIPPLTAADLGG